MPAVNALVEELRGHDVPVVFYNGNAASPEHRGAALDALCEASGESPRVGVLMHSLAFGTLRPFFGDKGALSERQMDMTCNIMGHSLVYWTQDLVSRGLMGSGGRIYAMTSSGSIAAWPAYGAVSAAKSTLESHIRQLAVELAPHGITANAIMAGVTDTPALRKIPGHEAIIARALDRNPHQRLTTPEDVARCLLTLSQQGTQWLTGNVLRVDGGETICG
jgi:NAD(P)-dependent dehydrogenase (short-subunit alcohol dehydrogenase family)